MSTAPITFAPTLAPEELARANFYGLIARLFYAPPDATLLQTIAAAEDLEAEEGGVALAWRDLAQAAAAAEAEAVKEEYDGAFIGVGKAPITLYTSAYSVRYTNEVPLADLRRDLAELHLARRSEATEPEDHISALSEVMRHLISERRSGLEPQKIFFEKWIWPTAQPLCTAIEKSEQIRFYRSVARFAFAFFDIERSAFEML
jgi:TorA maturation chaperone TorD